ncbi:hypothetical protein PM082_015507 [Marasmius tenuissimus]|nr:hypothetical protein PM082_015507 [Marasmius tenuissimus]
MRLHLRYSDRSVVWEYMLRQGNSPQTTPRYTSATIDLALNPGEILLVLLLTGSFEIETVEFMSSARIRAEWALNLGTSYMLPTIITQLQQAHHFVLFNISLRFQWTLLHAAKGQITTLEMHNPRIPSHGYTVTPVVLQTLQALHLFDDTSSSIDFLLRVVQCIVAPGLTTLTIGRCSSGGSTAVHDTVKAFSGNLRSLHILNKMRPSDDDITAGTPLPSLAAVHHLELDLTWAGLYLSTSGETFPSVRTIALHSSPLQVMAGLPDLDAVWLRNGLLQVEGTLEELELCYRSSQRYIRDSFRTLVANQLREVGPPLPEGLVIMEGLRDYIPISPPRGDAIEIGRLWDGFEG